MKIIYSRIFEREAISVQQEELTLPMRSNKGEEIIKKFNRDKNYLILDPFCWAWDPKVE